MHLNAYLSSAAIVLLFSSSAAGATERVAVHRTAMAIYAPEPKYPLFAVIRHEQGGGIFVFRVDIKSGRVKQVIVAQSTGHADLDAAAMKAFRRWKFVPGAVPSIKQIRPDSKDPLATQDGLVKIPVTFTVR
jgi:TonB family protein